MSFNIKPLSDEEFAFIKLKYEISSVDGLSWRMFDADGIIKPNGKHLILIGLTADEYVTKKVLEYDVDNHNFDIVSYKNKTYIRHAKTYYHINAHAMQYYEGYKRYLQP